MYLDAVEDFRSDHPATLGLEWRRHYSTTSAQAVPHPLEDLGSGWGHSYGDRLFFSNGQAVWVRENLQKIKFKSDCGGGGGGCTFSSPYDTDDSLVELPGPLYALTIAGGERRLRFDATGILTAVERPTQAGWVTAVALEYYQQAGGAPCGGAAVELAGKLCRAIAPSSDVNNPYGVLQFLYTLYAVAGGGANCHRYFLSQVDWEGPDPATVATYTHETSQECGGGACEPRCVVGRLTAATIGGHTWTYQYNNDNVAAPLLTRVTSPEDVITERHSYEAFLCATSADCAPDPVGASRACTDGRCEYQGFRRVTESGRNCSSVAPENCEELLRFSYSPTQEDRPPPNAGRYMIYTDRTTTVTDVSTSREWEVHHERNRITSAGADCGCAAGSDYTWLAETDASGNVVRRVKQAQRNPVTSSTGQYRYTTYDPRYPGSCSASPDCGYGGVCSGGRCQSIDGSKMQPGLVVEGDTNTDPTDAWPADALPTKRTYHPLGYLTSESIEVEPGVWAHVIYDYDIAGPTANCSSTPRSFNLAPTNGLRRRIEIGRTSVDTSGAAIACNDATAPVRVTTYGYDADDRLTSADGPLAGNVDEVTYEYYPVAAGSNNSGRLYRVLRGRTAVGGASLVAVEYAAYNPRGQAGSVSTEFDPSGAASDFTISAYDGVTGWLLSVTEPGAALPTTYQYREDGALFRVTRPLGNYETYSYNEQGKLIDVSRRTVAGTQIDLVHHEYDPASQLLVKTTWSHGIAGAEVTDRIEGYRYDSKRRRIGTYVYRDSSANPALERITHLDSAGRVDWEVLGTQIIGWTAVCELDADRSCVHPDGGSCLFDLCSQADVKNVYDDRGRLAAVYRKTEGSFGAILETEYTHDRRGNLTTVRGGSPWRTSTYVYDDYGALVSVTTPDAGTVRSKYNAAGQLVARRPAHLGADETYAYDGAGRLTAEEYPGSNPDSTVYTYGSAATPASLPHPRCDNTPVATSSVQGRLWTVAHGPAASRLTTYYGYTPEGRLSYEATEYPGENCVRLLSHAYDANGNVSSLTYPTQRVVTFEHLGTDVDRPSAVKTTFQGAQTTLASNVAFFSGQLASYKTGSNLDWTRTRRYDGSVASTGQKYGATDWVKLNVGSQTALGAPLALTNSRNPYLDQSFTYGTFGRLLTATAGDPTKGTAYCSQVLTYRDTAGDRGGNTLAATSCVPPVADTYAYRSPWNSLLASRSSGPTYYCNGTWIPATLTCTPAGAGLSGATMVIDNNAGGAHKLTTLGYDDKLRVSSHNYQGLQYDYLYDHQNRRYGKVSGGNSRRTDFFYSPGGELLSEIGWTSVTQFWPRPLREYVYLGGERIAILQATATAYTGIKAYTITDNALGYVAQDHLATSVAVTDANRAFVWRGERQPFGQTKVLLPSTPEVFALPLQGSALPVPESAHNPYQNPANLTWTVAKPPGATSFSLVFSNFDVAGGDTVTIEKATAPFTVYHTYSGALGGFSVPAKTDASLVVRLTSKASPQTLWGFKVSEVKAIYGSLVLNVRLPGQYYDSESGFHYNWNRYYEPSTGRYLSPDPLLVAPDAGHALLASIADASQSAEAYGISRTFDPGTLPFPMEHAAFAYGLNRPMDLIDSTGAVPTPPVPCSTSMDCYCGRNPHDPACSGGAGPLKPGMQQPPNPEPKFPPPTGGRGGCSGIWGFCLKRCDIKCGNRVTKFACYSGCSVLYAACLAVPN